MCDESSSCATAVVRIPQEISNGKHYNNAIKIDHTVGYYNTASVTSTDYETYKYYTICASAAVISES